MKHLKALSFLILVLVVTWLTSLLPSGDQAWAVGSQSPDRQTVPLTQVPLFTRTPVRTTPAPGDTSVPPQPRGSIVSSAATETPSPTPATDSTAGSVSTETIPAPNSTPGIARSATPRVGLTLPAGATIAVTTPVPNQSAAAPTALPAINAGTDAGQDATEPLSAGSASLVGVGFSIGVVFVVFGMLLALVSRRRSRK